MMIARSKNFTHDKPKKQQFYKHKKATFLHFCFETFFVLPKKKDKNSTECHLHLNKSSSPSTVNVNSNISTLKRREESKFEQYFFNPRSFLEILQQFISDGKVS